jgi:Tfp pilus assembly protein PilX
MNTPQYKDERGIVSIIVTMIIMVLLSLIVLGFAQVSRREQRQGLDRQLASQASYAAETGINDAVAYLKQGGTLSGNANVNCNQYTSADAALGTVANGTYRAREIDDANQVVASCVLVDNAVTNLEYSNVTPDEEVVFPLRIASGATIDRIRIEWQDDSTAGTMTAADLTACGNSAAVTLPTNANGQSCPVGMLRVDTTPVNAGDASRQTITSATVGMVLRPQDGRAGTPTHTTANGGIYGAYCTATQTPRRCSTVVRVTPATTVYVKIRPMYRSANLNITVNSGARLIGAQALIDSTGKANDVLKRLVARVPVCQTGLTCGRRPNPGFAIQSADTLCKLYGVVPAPANQLIVGDSSDPNCAIN